MRNFLLLSVFFTSISALGYEFSVMTYNTQNLFDTLDDPKKNDKAYLPIELKQSKKHIDSCKYISVKSWKDECLNLDWDDATKNAKLANLATEILKYDNSGPDILALQEVENLNILTQLFELLEPFGYKDFTLIVNANQGSIGELIMGSGNLNLSLDASVTKIAFDKDIFGAPTFVVNNKIFWGQDRLDYALDEYNT